MRKNILLCLLAGAASYMAADAQVMLRYGLELNDGWGGGMIVATPYVRFPQSTMKAYAGNRITKVRIGVNDTGKNCYLYIKNDPKDATSLYRMKLENLEKGWNEIVLDEPFEITGDADISIGYKASFNEPGSVGVSKEKFAEATTVYLNSSNNWTTTGGGAIAIQAVVEGDNLPTDYLWLRPSNNGTSTLNVPYEADSYIFPLQVRNQGVGNITGFSIRMNVNGEESVKEYTANIGLNEVYDLEYEIKSDNPGLYTVSFEIDKVNGADNKYPVDINDDTYLKVWDPEFRRRVVMEEYSGLWCGLCPAAMVAIDEELAKFPDTFIPICAHGGDLLTIELPEDAPVDYSYAPFINDCIGAPWSWVDRKIKGDPSLHASRFNNMETYYDNNVNYDLKAYWDGDPTTTNRIKLVSTLYTSEDVPEVAYRLAYAVTEDNLTGYYQTNYYADNAGGPMGGWEDKAPITNDVVFNDIARGIFPDFYGEEVTDIISTEAYKRYTHEYMLTLPAELLAKTNRDNMHVVGLLITDKNGYIVNAMKVAPTENSGVENVMADNGVTVRSEGYGLEVSNVSGNPLEVVVYDFNGREIGRKSGANGYARLNAEGHVIVRVFEDGVPVKTCKMIVK